MWLTDVLVEIFSHSRPDVLLQLRLVCRDFNLTLKQPETLAELQNASLGVVRERPYLGEVRLLETVATFKEFWSFLYSHRYDLKRTCQRYVPDSCLAAAMYLDDEELFFANYRPPMSRSLRIVAKTKCYTALRWLHQQAMNDNVEHELLDEVFLCNKDQHLQSVSLEYVNISQFVLLRFLHVHITALRNSTLVLILDTLCAKKSDTLFEVLRMTSLHYPCRFTAQKQRMVTLVLEQRPSDDQFLQVVDITIKDVPDLIPTLPTTFFLRLAQLQYLPKSFKSLFATMLMQCPVTLCQLIEVNSFCSKYKDNYTSFVLDALRLQEKEVVIALIESADEDCLIHVLQLKVVWRECTRQRESMYFLVREIVQHIASTRVAEAALVPLMILELVEEAEDLIQTFSVDNDYIADALLQYSTVSNIREETYESIANRLGQFL